MTNREVQTTSKKGHIKLTNNFNEDGVGVSAGRGASVLVAVPRRHFAEREPKVRLLFAIIR